MTFNNFNQSKRQNKLSYYCGIRIYNLPTSTIARRYYSYFSKVPQTSVNR